MGEGNKVVGLFGCTGATGLHVTRYALDQGHTVFALLRTSSKLKLHGLSEDARGRLHTVQGDIYNQAAVEEVVSRSDVVIETLGVSVNRPTTTKQDGTRAILMAMQKFRKTRFVAVTSAIVREEGRRDKPRIARALLDFLLDHISADLKAQEDVILAESDWLDYTIFEPPGLIAAEPTGKTVISCEEPPPGPSLMPFADLGQAMLDAAVSGSYSKEIVFIKATQKVKGAWKDTKKQRALVFDNVLTKMLVPGVKAILITTVVVYAYESAKHQYEKRVR